MDHLRVGLSAREEKQLRALKQRKHREHQGAFLAEGMRVVEELLASTIEIEWVLAASSLEDSARGQGLVAAVQRKDLPLRLIADAAFQKLAPTEHSQGILAVARVPAPDWDVIGGEQAGSVVLLLDAVQDPGNLGTLARTAEALGVRAVVILPGTVDPWNPKSVRAAAGSLFRLPLLASDWAGAERRLRAAGYRLLGSEVGGEPPAPTGRRVGLVVGNEGAGMSPDVRSALDGTVGIPLRGRAESLNVAAAAAILLYELTRSSDDR